MPNIGILALYIYVSQVFTGLCRSLCTGRD